MLCPSCKALIPDDSVFCNSRRLRILQQMREFCGGCFHSPLRDSDRFPLRNSNCFPLRDGRRSPSGTNRPLLRRGHHP